MFDEVKAMRLAALMDEQHRAKHPTPLDRCKYCEYLETRVCEHCGQRPCTAQVETRLENAAPVDTIPHPA